MWQPTGRMGQNLDPNERIEVILKDVGEFFNQLIRGDCTDLEVGFIGLYTAGFLDLATGSTGPRLKKSGVTPLTSRGS